MRLRLHKLTKTHAIYKTGKFSSLNDGILASVLKMQPQAVPNAVLLFDDKIENEQKISPTISKKYYSAIIYAAHPRQLRFDASSLPVSLKQSRLSFSQMRDLFLFQGKKFAKKMGQKYVDEHKSTTLMLKGARHISFRKEGKPVSLFILLRLTDYSGRKRNWLCWDWKREGLSSEEKAGIESYLYGWMKRYLRGRIESKARICDVKSQDYFRRHGFIPTAVTVRGSINMLSRHYGVAGRK